MNSKKKLVIGCAVLALLLLSASLLYRSLSSNYSTDPLAEPSSKENSNHSDVSTENSDTSANTEESPTLAPDFSVQDSEGNMVKLSDFLGKPVVINFWASWCPPCKEEMPDFQTVYDEMGEDIVFLMVNATDGRRETKEIAADFIADSEFTFPVYYDTTQEASYSYGVSSLPSTAFIDKNGYLITGAIGMIDEETLRRGIDMIVD